MSLPDERNEFRHLLSKVGDPDTHFIRLGISLLLFVFCLLKFGYFLLNHLFVILSLASS